MLSGSISTNVSGHPDILSTREQQPIDRAAKTSLFEIPIKLSGAFLVRHAFPQRG